MKRRIGNWIARLPFPFYKLALYFSSLALIGVGCSSIYLPLGFLAVGGLLWLDLFVSDLIVQLKMDLRDQERSDVRPR